MPRPDFSNYESFSCRCCCRRIGFRRSPVARVIAFRYAARSDLLAISRRWLNPILSYCSRRGLQVVLRVIPFSVTGPATAHAGLLPCGIRPNSRAALVVVGFPRLADYRVQQWPPSGRNLFAVSRSNSPFPGLAGPIACRVHPSPFPVVPVLCGVLARLALISPPQGREIGNTGRNTTQARRDSRRVVSALALVSVPARLAACGGGGYHLPVGNVTGAACRCKQPFYPVPLAPCALVSFITSASRAKARPGAIRRNLTI